MAMAAIPPVNQTRIRILTPPGSAPAPAPGPIIYWMFRDQRAADNHALLHALHLSSLYSSPVAVAFTFISPLRFLNAHSRQILFMLRGLKTLSLKLRSLNIPFFFFRGDPIDTIPRFVKDCGAAVLVTDFTPLRPVREWKEEIVKRIEGVEVHEVDAHNVVPVWVASGKLEYSAKTIRGKIQKLLPEYLVEFPDAGRNVVEWRGGDLPEIDWDELLAEAASPNTYSDNEPYNTPVDDAYNYPVVDAYNYPTGDAYNYPVDDAYNMPYSPVNPHNVDYGAIGASKDNSEGEEVQEIEWCKPGEDAAMEVLMGSTDGFLTKRLRSYYTDRNNPLKPKALSGLSPYLHFGQISAQRCALNAKSFRNSNPQAIDAFLEELIIRRELADNFCYYQPHYDSLQGAWEWARKTLMDHAADKREHIYTKEQLEKAKTADPLWNASQQEMVHNGKMHGFMRMYWAKKILEWTCSPEEALSIAIYLNDKYEIDGRDPNGYVGCMWSICGVHDQGWKERPVFGKIRYMNYAGCKRKFDVDGYIAYVNRLVGESRKRKLSAALSLKPKQSRVMSPE